MRKMIVLILICLWTSVVAGDQSPAPPLALIHVTVVDVTGKPPKADMTVLVDGAQIVAVGPSAKVNVPGNARIVDGSGKFLMPGLWDMHVHTLSTAVARDTFFPLFVANGVTGVRDMGSSVTAEELGTVRQDIRSGARVGPRIVAAGRILDGPKPINPGVSTAVTDERSARESVRQLKTAGADFIKVYSLLSREAYFAIAAEAKKSGLPFAGHVPLSVTAEEASAAGQKSMEHMFAVLEGCSSREDDLRSDALATAPMGMLRSQARSIDDFDRRKAARLYRVLAKNQTWQVPTLAVRATVSGEGKTSAGDPRLEYIYAELRERWTGGKRFAALSQEDRAALGRLFPAELRIIGEMHRAGVPFLAGTDTPNPFVLPGYSIHDELEFLVRAGLTPLQALQSATIAPARFLSLSGVLGTVEKGKIADLVLLDANPLSNIANTRAVHGVVANGRWLDRKHLDELLAGVRVRASQR